MIIYNYIYYICSLYLVPLPILGVIHLSILDYNILSIIHYLGSPLG